MNFRLQKLGYISNPAYLSHSFIVLQRQKQQEKIIIVKYMHKTYCTNQALSKGIQIMVEDQYFFN